MIDINSIKVGWFLGYRQLKRASLWSNILIVAVMLLTFMNLVAVSGILVGLIEGSENANRNYYTSDVIVSTLKEKDYIENSRDIIANIENLPGVERYSARYLASGSVEANYKERTNFEDKRQLVGSIIAGIDPIKENQLTQLSDSIVEGEYLEPDDYDHVILGAYLLEKYLPVDSPGFLVLSDVKVGDKIKIKIGENEREVFVKGIARNKVDEVDRRVFMLDSQLRSIVGRDDLNVSEISIQASEDYSPEWIKDSLEKDGYGSYAKIQTYLDAQPQFLVDIKNTFNLLGTIISSIGLVVAAITVFIVIFINAITRRKYIGIMKAIGVDGKTLELSYVFQSMVYAITGSVLGLIMVYGVLVPYVAANPIDFPFSDGILVAPFGLTFMRVAILLVVTGVAGYLPARIIIKKNTLDSILGRD